MEMDLKESVIVTGASGFIGQHLCRALQAQGVFVWAINRSPKNGPWDRQIIMDITNPDSEFNISGLDRVSAIFHLAAEVHSRGSDEKKYLEKNVQGTQNLIQFAKKNKISQLIHLSTIKVLGEVSPTDGFNPQDPPYPTTPYAKSKRAAEKLILDSGFPKAINLRLPAIYGKGMKGSLKQLIDFHVKGHSLPVPLIHNKRDFVHVNSVVKALIQIWRDPQLTQKNLTITEGHPLSINDIVLEVRRVLQQPPSFFRLPLWVWKSLAKLGDLLGTLLRRPLPYNTLLYQALFANAFYSTNSSDTNQPLVLKEKHLMESLKELVSWRQQELKKIPHVLSEDEAS